MIIHGNLVVLVWTKVLDWLTNRAIYHQEQWHLCLFIGMKLCDYFADYKCHHQLCCDPASVGLTSPVWLYQFVVHSVFCWLISTYSRDNYYLCREVIKVMFFWCLCWTIGCLRWIHGPVCRIYGDKLAKFKMLIFFSVSSPENKIVVFSLPSNKLFISTKGVSLCLLRLSHVHRHPSTVAQNGRTKLWLQMGQLRFLIGHCSKKPICNK